MTLLMPLPVEAVLQLMPERGHLLALGQREVCRPYRADTRIPVEYAAAAVVAENDSSGAVRFAAGSVDFLRRSALPFDCDAIRDSDASAGQNDKKNHESVLHWRDCSADRG